MHLGRFATAEEAALCVAQTPEGKRRAAAASPLTSEEALQQARKEGLTLLLAKPKTGYFGVNVDESRKTKPFGARVRRGGKDVRLGSFVTAEEAALCVARSQEGQAQAAQRVGVSGGAVLLLAQSGLGVNATSSATSVLLTLQQARVAGLTLTLTPTPT